MLPMMVEPERNDGIDTFQSYRDVRLAFTVPEYQLVGLRPVPAPSTREEFHWAK